MSVGLAGCGAPVSPSTLDALSHVRCGAHRPALYAAVDVSDTGRSRALLSEHLSTVHSELTAVAVCGGRARVVAFTGSVAAMRTLFDGPLVPQGATRIARLRRVPALVQSAMGAITAALGPALAALPGRGSDPLGQLDAAAEFAAQVGTDHTLQVLLLGDGIEDTASVTLNDRSVAAATAVALGKRVPVPRLASSSVTIAGIGKTVGAPAPTGFVEALKQFWWTVCRRTSASCTVVTDFEGARR